MSNRTISIVFMALSWLMLTFSTMLAIPVFIFYSLVCIFMSHVIYHKQNEE